ncbi:MAG: hypothetical protein GY757_42215 [bacterium]|nr:hypothetical protein [bacterium]
MIYLRSSIAEFLVIARKLINGVKNDDFVKERVLTYNFDDTRIAECEAAFLAAENAENIKSQEYGEQLEAGAIYQSLMEPLEKTVKKHNDFLKLALRNNIEKQKKLMLVGHPRSRKLKDWFKYIIELYNRLLADDTCLTAMAGYGFTLEMFAATLQDLKAAQIAKDNHDKERGEAEAATEIRDTVFETLNDLVDELTLICKYSLEDRPQYLETLGIPVYSPGYKKKKKKKQ